VEITRDALERWVRMGLPVRISPSGERFYDPVEVFNFMKQASIDLGDPYWVERFVKTGQRTYLQQSAALGKKGTFANSRI
jgi:hypothetical protein